MVNKGNRELTEVRKRTFGESFWKLKDIWCIFEILRVFGDFFNLSEEFGEKNPKKKVKSISGENLKTYGTTQKLKNHKEITLKIPNNTASTHIVFPRSMYFQAP